MAALLTVQGNVKFENRNEVRVETMILLDDETIASLQESHQLSA